MKRMHASVPFGLAIAMLLFVGAAHADTPPPVQKWSIVGLGDSVMSGWACECRTFIELYADGVRSKTSIPTEWRNLGTLAQTSGDLLRLLETSDSARAIVARANIVVITVGANDFPPNHYLSSCVLLRCYIT